MKKAGLWDKFAIARGTFFKLRVYISILRKEVRIAQCKLSIARKKIRIARYKLAIVIKSELWNINLQLWGEKTQDFRLFPPHNYEIISHNTLFLIKTFFFTKKRSQNSMMQPHNCVEKKVKIAINLQLYEKKLWDTNSQLWGKKSLNSEFISRSSDFISRNCVLISHNSKNSQNSGIKRCNSSFLSCGGNELP